MTAEKIKKLKTNVRSAQSCAAMVPALTLFVIIRAAFSHKFDFYFSAYVPQNLFSEYLTDGKIFGLALAIGYIIIMLVPVILFPKIPKMIFFVLSYYVFDTAMLIISFTEFLSLPLRGNLIDLVFHAFMLVFFTVGAVSFKKLQKLDPKDIEAALKSEEAKESNE